MRFLSALVLVLCISCDVQKVDPNDSQSLIGSWNWVLSQGGFANLTIKPSSTLQKKLSFTKDGKCQITENDKILFNINYQVNQGKTIISTDIVPLIVFPENDGFKWSYQIKGDSLFISEEVYDGFGHTYVRIK